MNLFELIKAIKVQNEEDIPLSYDDFLAEGDTESQDIINSINYVNNSICNASNWNFRESKAVFQSAINKEEYEKPFGKIWKLKHEGQITPLGEIHYDYIIDNPQSGMPSNYSFYGDKLILYPVPVEVKTITAYYYTNNFAYAETGKTPKEKLNAETDYSIIPSHLHDVIIFGACIEHYKKPSREKSVLWQTRYSQIMSDFESATKSSVNEYGRVVFGERPKDIIQDFFDPRK